jgi:RNA polymerase primary sigma factor
MNDLDFSFEQSPWELALTRLNRGGSISAMRFLTLLEGEAEDAVEAAFEELENRHITLDIGDLPDAGASAAMALRLRREAELVEKGTLMTDLEAEDPLRLYLEEIAGIPAAGDPVLLAQQSLEGNTAARNMLVNVSLHRVIAMSMELAGKGVLLLDLIQEASLGLWQAILNWDGQGDFESHRDWYIRQSLAKQLTLQARQSGVGQKMRTLLEDYRSADQRLLTKIGRNPTLEEIAAELKLTPEDTAVLEKMLQNAQLIQRSKAAQEPRQDDPDEERHVEDTAYFQSRQRIMEMLSGLEELDAKILSLRFGLEGGLPLNPQDTGNKLGLTPEEVVTREAKALAKLRSET